MSVCGWLYECWGYFYFIKYVIAALQRIEPEIGEAALALLQSPQQLPFDAISINLIQEIADIANDFVLVFDDYHSIDTAKIHQFVEFLIDRMPSQMHLVIATRVDPNLPLPRLRVRNQLNEFRVTDLFYLIERLWLAIVLKNSGRLPEAMDICRQFLNEVNDKTLAFNVAVGHVWGALGEMLYELNELDEAHHYAKEGLKLMEQGHDVSHPGWRYVCLAKILCSRQDLDGAEKIVLTRHVCENTHCTGPVR